VGTIEDLSQDLSVDTVRLRVLVDASVDLSVHSRVTSETLCSYEVRGTMVDRDSMSDSYVDTVLYLCRSHHAFRFTNMIDATRMRQWTTDSLAVR
jgi:hypothetical protein